MSRKIFLILILISIFSLMLFSLYSFYVFPTPNWDEVSFGYNAFSVLKTGQDEWGKWFPLIFRAFGDYKLPLYTYLSIIPIAVFGLNTFSIRFTSILAGTLLSPVIYLIAKKLRLSTKLSLFLAFISVLNPWHLWLSSTALESNLALTIFAWGIYLGILYLEKEHLKYLLLTTIFFGLTLHTYNSYRVISPIIFLTIIGLAIRYKTILSLKNLLISLTLFSLFSLPVIYQIYKGYGRARFNTVSLFKDPGIKLSVENDRSFPHDKLTARLFHNYPLYLFQKLSFNYLNNYSPEFLFLNGGKNLAFSPPNYGHFYWWEICLWLIGLIILIKNLLQKSSSSHLLLLVIFLIAPLPAIVTLDGAHTLRSYTLLIPSLFFIGWGLKNLYTPKTSILFISLYLVSFFFFNEYALNHYSKHYDSHWLSAENQAIKYAVTNQNKYQVIAIPKDSVDEAYIFYLFYSRMKPNKFWQLAQRRFSHNWYWVDKIGKVTFPETTNSGAYENNPHALLITKHPIYTKHHTLATFQSKDKKIKLEAITFPKNED